MTSEGREPGKDDSYAGNNSINYDQVILGESNNSIRIISNSTNGLVLEIFVGSFLKSEVEIDKETYNSIKLEGEGLIKEKGFPELPKISRSILIPGTSGYEVNILSADYEDIILPVTPSKGIISRLFDPDEVPYQFSSIYSQDVFYPADRCQFGEPYLIRDSRGIVINIFPFDYNPARKILRIFKKLEIEIQFTGTNLKNSIPISGLYKNEYFEPILSNHFINYTPENIPNGYKIVDETGKMLVICYDDFMDEMVPFINFKNNRGLQTEIVSMSVVGTTANDIASYIQTSYDGDNSLTFVLLVGDHTQIPSLFYGGGGSDPSFSLVSGSDNYPDIIIGRFSAELEDQVETMVNRSIFYENMAEQSWFHSGMGIASDDGSGNGDDGEYDWEHLRNIRTDLLNFHYTSVAELYEGSRGGEDAAGNPNSTMVSNLVNSGVSIINYTGHGSTSSWATSGFSKTNVNALTNDNMLPFIFSVACVNGNFTSGTCFAESWLRATNSANGQPTGAIGFYASSINQSWSPPMEAQDEFNSLLVNEDNITFGALCYNGSCSMMDDYGSGDGQAGTDMFLTWHIFGDPSIHVIPNPLGNCMDDLTITEQISGGNYTFSANNTITASNIITDGAEVHYGANGSVILMDGFSVDLGSEFKIDFNGCAQLPLKSTLMDIAESDYLPNTETTGGNIGQLEIHDKEPIITIYPNPTTSGKFQIKVISTDEPQHLQIINSTGNIIFEEEHPGKTVEIENIPEKGLIFIHVIFDETLIVRKLISL